MTRRRGQRRLIGSWPLAGLLLAVLAQPGCGAGQVAVTPDHGAGPTDAALSEGGPGLDRGPDAAWFAEAGATDGAPKPDQAPAAACYTVGAWKSSATFVGAGHVAHPLPSFASGGFYYVHTMKLGGSERRLYSAQQLPGGDLAAWKQASPDHGGGPHGFTAIDVDGSPLHFRNGHIARYDFDASGVMQGDVKLLEASTDTAFGGSKYVWDSAVLAHLPGGQRHVFHLGGFSFTGYTYRQDVYHSAVPLQSAFSKTGRSHPATRPGKAAFYAPPGGTDGFIFTAEAQGPRLWRTRVKPGGLLDPFVALQDLPAGSGNERGELLVYGNTLLAVRGAKVFRAVISSAGALTSWLSAPALPEAQVDVSWGDGHLEGASSGLIGAHVYVTGPTRVFHAPLQAATACGP